MYSCLIGDTGTAKHIEKALPSATVESDVIAIAGTTAPTEQDKAASEAGNCTEPCR